MLPLERQKQIKEWVQDEQHVKISELSKWFGVSEMTIHRDIKPLVNDGLVNKTFGGISLVPKQQEKRNSHLTGCVYCHREIQERLAYRLILDNHETEIACCAHCGLLRHHQLGNKVVQALCTDFLKQMTTSAALARYVVDTTADLGCCHPQVLTFAQKEAANKFVKEFGGSVFSFHDIIDVISHRMNGSDSCCLHHQGSF